MARGIYQERGEPLTNLLVLAATPCTTDLPCTNLPCMHHWSTMDHIYQAPQIQQCWTSMDHTKPCSEHLSYRIFNRDSGEFSGMKIKTKNLNLFRLWWLWWWRVEGGVQPKCTFQVLSIHVMSCQYQFPYQWQPFHRYDLSHTSLADLRPDSGCNIWSCGAKNQFWPLP